MSKPPYICRLGILKLSAALQIFVRVEGMVSSYYVAARADCLEVVCRRERFGTQPAEVSLLVEAMMTAVSTLKPRHRNVLGFVPAACKVALYGKTAPASIRALDSQSTRSCVPPWRPTEKGDGYGMGSGILG